MARARPTDGTEHKLLPRSRRLRTLPSAARRGVLCAVTETKGINKKNLFLGSDHTDQHGTRRPEGAAQRKMTKTSVRGRPETRLGPTNRDTGRRWNYAPADGPTPAGAGLGRHAGRANSMGENVSPRERTAATPLVKKTSSKDNGPRRPVTRLTTTPNHDPQQQQPDLSSSRHTHTAEEACGTRNRVQNTVAPFLFQTHKTRREHCTCPDAGKRARGGGGRGRGRPPRRWKAMRV